MRNELKQLIPHVNEEGLGFLLRQAQVIIHNINVDRANEILAKPGRTNQAKAFRKADATMKRESSDVSIEDSASGKHFVVVLGPKRKMFSRDELRKLVIIAHSTKNDGAAGEQLYNWMKRNRGDVLLDVAIGNKKHPLFSGLARYLRSNYAARK